MAPGDFQYRLDEARHLLLNGDFAPALSKYEKLTRTCPGIAGLWFEYGNAAAGVREVGLAQRAWQKAIETEPTNSELLVQVGHQYESLRRPEQARACFARAAAAAPAGIDPRISQAVLLERQH
jgi:Flp pilus assembly protein TadD